MLAAAGADGALTLWDIGQLSAPKPLGTASGITGPLRALRFSPDGTALAGIDDHGGVHLWDVSTPEDATVTGDFPSLSDDLGNNLGLTAPRAGGGRLVFSAGAPGTIAIRDTEPDALARRVCSTTGAPLSRSQWHQYVPEVGYAAPCGPGK